MPKPLVRGLFGGPTGTLIVSTKLNKSPSQNGTECLTDDRSLAFRHRAIVSNEGEVAVLTQALM